MILYLAFAVMTGFLSALDSTPEDFNGSKIDRWGAIIAFGMIWPITLGFFFSDLYHKCSEIRAHQKKGERRVTESESPKIP